jgi:hypothetical protein
MANGGPVLRQAAATARQVLLGLASAQLGVAASQLSVTDGVVSGGGKSVKYSDLLGGKLFNAFIAGVPTGGVGTGFGTSPTTPGTPAPIKLVSQYKVVGTRVPRIDIPDKVTGKYTFRRRRKCCRHRTSSRSRSTARSARAAQSRTSGRTAERWQGQDGWGFRSTAALVTGLNANSFRVVHFEGSSTYNPGPVHMSVSDAALMSQLAGKPVRVQTMRWDENGYSPMAQSNVANIRAGLDAKRPVHVHREPAHYGQDAAEHVQALSAPRADVHPGVLGVGVDDRRARARGQHGPIPVPGEPDEPSGLARRPRHSREGIELAASCRRVSAPEW